MIDAKDGRLVFEGKEANGPNGSNDNRIVVLDCHSGFRRNDKVLPKGRDAPPGVVHLLRISPSSIMRNLPLVS